MADRVKRLVYTVCTSDWYQHFLPLFAHRIVESTDADVRIAVRGKTDDLTNKAIKHLPAGRVYIQEDKFLEYPDEISTTNSLRFMRNQCDGYYDEVLIMDIDLMIFEDPFPWHEKNLIDGVYCGHRGPQSKPHRPEISPAGWVGRFERVAGGFIMVTPEWYDRTRPGREAAMMKLKHSIIGTFRESDEVTLARIIKRAEINMPPSKYFPLELRGLHMGDFRENMRHRWSSPAKMSRKLSDANARKYYTMTQEDDTWKAMVSILKADSAMAQVLANIDVHLDARNRL